MFSEIVDDIVKRSGRLDRRADIVDYCNATIKELQAKVLFTRDLVETELTVSDIPLTWNRPTFFRTLRAVKYAQSGFDDIYPKFLMPGRQQRDRDLLDQFFYAASDYFVFSGVTTSQTVKLAYYTRFRRYKYYVAAERPAVYDAENESWTYLQNGSFVSTLGSDALNEAAQVKVANWLMLNYQELVKEGTLAKILKTVNDARAISTFALFKSMTEDFMSEEPHDTLAGQGIT